MALSGTMSNPSDWLQFYNLQNNTISGAPVFHQDPPAASLVSHHDSTVVTTTATATATAPAPAANPSSTNNNSLSPEGRVSKPVRKRSRASRRTPTTLLNTDTSNFRAMVQQFTGGPSTASFAPQPNNFGFTRQGFVNNPNNNASVMLPPSAGYNSHHHLQLQHQQQQQQSPYLLSLSNNNNNDSNHQGFVQRLMSSGSASAAVAVRPTANMGVPFSCDEFAASSQLQLQGQASLVGNGRPNNSKSSNENRSNSFLY